MAEQRSTQDPNRSSSVDPPNFSNNHYSAPTGRDNSDEGDDPNPKQSQESNGEMNPQAMTELGQECSESDMGETSTDENPDSCKIVSEEQPKSQEVLNSLGEILTPECIQAAGVLMKDYSDHMHQHMAHLSDFFTHLKESIDSYQRKGKKKSKKGDKQSSGSSMSSSWLPWNSRAPVKVFKVVTDQTFGADESILKMVQRLTLKYTKNQQQCDVIIVFCPITSRVASDVDAAMRRLKADRPVILVLMHHTRDQDYSTGQTDWSETYRNIELYVHVLYHESLGGLLQNCPVNSLAIQQLTEGLNRFSH